jgi:glycosyltransferase involved in cell wall biosynthesis
LLLKEARAMVLLSDYGYGFKTKLLEAIAAKVYIIMTEGLYNRLSLEIKPFCIPVDIGSTTSFINALEKCKQPYPTGNPNAIRRKIAYETLDQLILESQKRY